MSMELKAGYKKTDLGVMFSFPRSAWECSLGRSSGSNTYATLERRDLLPRWSVGARNAALAAPAARTHTRRWSVGTCSHAGAWEPEKLSFPRSAWECSLGRSSGPYSCATLECRDLGWISAAHPPEALNDLKIDEVQHQDIGQMNLYLGYFAKEENIEGENRPIGIILSRHKDELLVEYATYQMNSQIFVQKYQLYLPEREDLRRDLELTLREAGQ